MGNLVTIAQFEIVRLLQTRRGMISLVGFALVWFVILRYGIYPASRFLAGSANNVLLRALLGEINMDQVADWLVPELTAYWIFSLMFLPFFCIVLTADQTASDRARGSLRFLHLRATRSEIFFGRFAGQMLLQVLFILATILTTFGLAVFRDQTLLADGLPHFSVIVVNLIIVLLPYTALMAMVSILAKSARQATIYAMIIWIVVLLLVGYLKTHLPDFTVLDWVLPGTQISSLMKLHDWQTLSLAPGPLVQTAVLLLAGWIIARRIDL